jgi:hypothetical protein
MNEYLWDRSGVPDPEIERLEKTLAPLRLELERSPEVRRFGVPWGAIAACLVLGALCWQLLPHSGGERTDWVVAGSGRRVYSGDRLRAESGSRLALQSDDFGRIELQPGSEIRVMESAPGRQRMKLQRGQLHALIWAPPRQFVVDTPSVRAIDLGCQYDLSVDERGDGFLRVETGWVAFQTGQRESFIPAGAACRTTLARGPGIPFFEDAPSNLRSALAEYEQSGSAAALTTVLAAARREDGLTLWHLLGRVNARQADAVFDRFAQLVPLPADVSRDKVLARDPAAIDLCWNALELADASWWREWKRDWFSTRR